jgi:hypothetical protein
MIQGKQIVDYSITKSKFNLDNTKIINLTDIITKSYVDSITLSGVTKISNNLSNLNMSALNLISNSGYQLACSIPILSIPYSYVKVYVNGLEVNVGYGLDCYFSNDNGITLKDFGSETVGDYLFWNTNGRYVLDSTDEIDFVYLIKSISIGIGYDIIGQTTIK